MNIEEQNKALAERVKQLEQDKQEAEWLRIGEQEAKDAQFKKRAVWFWCLIIGAFLLMSGFSEGGLFREMFTANREEVKTSESACRGTANNYVSPFDRQTYTYTCGADGIWAYTDKFNEPSCELIKGNIAFETREKIYHVKGQLYYDDTRIDLDYGERWFCSEAEARAAGWRRAADF